MGMTALTCNLSGITIGQGHEVMVSIGLEPTGEQHDVQWASLIPWVPAMYDGYKLVFKYTDGANKYLKNVGLSSVGQKPDDLFRKLGTFSSLSPCIVDYAECALSPQEDQEVPKFRSKRTDILIADWKVFNKLVEMYPDDSMSFLPIGTYTDELDHLFDSPVWWKDTCSLYMAAHYAGFLIQPTPQRRGNLLGIRSQWAEQFDVHRVFLERLSELLEEE